MTFFPSSADPANRPKKTPKPKSKSDASLGDVLKSPLGITIGVIALIALIIFVASQVWTEVLWFDQLGAVRVVLTRWGAAAAIFVVTFAVQYAAVMSVIYWAYRSRPKRLSGQSGSTLREYQKAIEPFRKLLFWVLPALLSLMTAAGFAAQWQTFVVWLNRTSFGQTDPQFGLDIGFYVFTLPVLELISGFLLNTLVVCLLAVAIVGYLYGGISFAPRMKVTKAARLQFGLLGAGVSLVVAIRYVIGIYSLVLTEGEPVDGAMFKQVNAVMPAQIILAVISLLVAVMFLIAAFRGTWRLPAAGVAVTVVSALVVGGAYPALIQQFSVAPNEREKETEYIQRNIDATLAAYGLDEVEYQTYAATTTASPGQLREDSEATSQIRLLDPMVISPTFRQLQQSRPYYTFASNLSVDRYTIDDERRDTVIAVRDLYLPGLQTEQQTWVNLHTVYTHGFGVVAAYGNTVKPDGTPAFWESSIPSVGELGDYEPRVYFSANSPDYSIVGAPEGAAPQELDYPDDNAASGQVQTTFTGDGGPSMGNLWNKLLYAVKFGSTDIFFSSQTNSESQILYDRDPLVRVAKVAPYLSLEHKAYPAVVDMDGDDSTPKRLVWIVDAYTTSANYPYSQKTNLLDATTDSRSTDASAVLPNSDINYMRNSVKAVVDAYDGSVQLFAWDAEDPILQAWEGVYPGMISDISEVSGDLMSHFRYPEDMFKVQRQLLETYHVTEAAEFYTGGDRWRLSEDPTATTADGGTSTQLQAPYYLTMQMPGQESAEFSLTSVYVPAGGGEARRAAMAGFLAVDSETGDTSGEVREGYGKLRLMALPSSTTVPGPGQVQNNFNTDQQIAQPLNLLSQQGSSVIRGNLLTLPVGGGLLYVQPVYVQSTGSTSYPVLRYVLTAFGEQVGFAGTLGEALDQTFGGDAQATTADSDGAIVDATGEDNAQVLTQDEQLSAAIMKARDAMVASQQAMQDGDWAAYGQAQETLNAALEELVQLQELTDEAAGTGLESEGAQSGEVQFGDLGEDAEAATEGES